MLARMEKGNSPAAPTLVSMIGGSHRSRRKRKKRRGEEIEKERETRESAGNGIHEIRDRNRDGETKLRKETD